MTLEADDKSVDDAGEAAFAAAFSNEEPKQPEPKEKPEPATDAAREKAEPTPEYVQLTKDDVAALRAAAAEVVSLKQQQLKLNGNIGNLYKVTNELQSSKKAELSTAAYTKLKGEFPELADMTREMVESLVAGLKAPEIDDAAFERRLEQRINQRELVHLNDEYPDWKPLVGVRATPEDPTPETPFRTWLAGKDESYRERINGTESPAEILRAIRRFQNETRPAPKSQTSARDNARREQLRDSVQPRGDGAPPTSGKSDDDAFLSGFSSRS